MHETPTWAAMFIILMLIVAPITCWCVYAAKRRQASLASIFILIAAEAVLLAIVVALARS